jgi:hypothetical protein
MKIDQERAGLLVIRVWIERGTGAALRARITGTVDVAVPRETVTTAATAEEIVSQVRAWLDAFRSA